MSELKCLHGQDFEVIYSIVRGHVNEPKFKNLIDNIKEDILKEIEQELLVSRSIVVRRDHDGCTQLDWLIEKMIGEHLNSGKINF